MISDAAVSQARRLMELRENKDVTKAASDKAAEEYKDAEADFYETLQESSVKGTIKIELGDPWGTVAFFPRETYFGRVIKGQEAAARKYFTDRHMDQAMTEPKFVKARLNEVVRGVREQGGSMPPGLDYYANRGVTITRQKT